MDLQMKIAVRQSKVHYKSVLARYNKAENYFNREDVSLENKMKWIEPYIEIVKTLGSILEFIGAYTNDEAENGFQI